VEPVRRVGWRQGHAPLFTLVDHAGLDEDRARDWVIVRMVLNANWAQDAQRVGVSWTTRAGVVPVRHDHQGGPGLTAH
jgi:hypothetical protein